MRTAQHGVSRHRLLFLFFSLLSCEVSVGPTGEYCSTTSSTTTLLPPFRCVRHFVLFTPNPFPLLLSMAMHFSAISRKSIVKAPSLLATTLQIGQEERMEHVLYWPPFLSAVIFAPSFWLIREIWKVTAYVYCHAPSNKQFNISLSLCFSPSKAPSETLPLPLLRLSISVWLSISLCLAFLSGLQQY